MTTQGSERTPSAWAKACLALLQDISPDYRRNRDVTGRFIEFVRPDPTGLLVSQNFIRIRSDYSLCYALSFSTLPSKQLYYPLFAGSRFDHNRTIWRQFLDDVGISRGDPGYPSGLWSFGPWRSNTLENLARGLALNEEYLYPFYRQELKRGKSHLVSLFETAARLIPALDPAVPVLTQASSLGVDPKALAAYPLPSAELNALTVAKGGSCYVGFGPRTNTVDLRAISPEVMVLHFAEVFLRERHRLSQLLAIANAL